MDYAMHKRNLSAQLRTAFDLSAEEIAAWEKLCATVPALSSPFLSFSYVRAVAEAGMDVRVCVLYENGMVRGFLPYQFRTRVSVWTRSAEPAGGEMTDYFGLIVSADFRITSTELLQLARVNYLSFSHLDESQLLHGLDGEQPRTGLRIKLPGDSPGEAQPVTDAAAHAKKHKYVKDTERRARQLTREIGPIEFRLDVEEGRQELLEQLITHKRAQYQRTDAPDALKDPWKSTLLHKLSNTQSATCSGLLSSLSAGDQWVAFHFGIMGNGVLQYWLPVYNPEMSRYAPGRLLIHHIIDAAPAASIHSIDRGEGDTPSKRDLANEEHLFYRGAWNNKSIGSQVAQGLQSIKWKLGV